MLIPRRSHIARYRQIASAVSRHGLGFLVDELGLGWALPFHWGLLGHPRRALPYTRPEHLRMALEELGVTFIKLGQVLSTRPDLLPPAFIAELTKLRDQAPVAPAEGILRRIEEELGAPAGEVFRRFDVRPLASASIGQVHAAELPDGQEVVVKVMKPGVEPQVEADIEILTELARRAARKRFGAAYDLAALVDEFVWTLRGELDYLGEGRNAELLARNFAGEDWIHIPRVFWDFTTSRVLTLERLQGRPLVEVTAGPGEDFDRSALAANLIRWVLKQVFEDGFFHADPHPGNFLLLPRGVIGVVDFGMVGYIDEESRYELLRLLRALVEQDGATAVEVMERLGASGVALNRSLLTREVHRTFARYYGLKLDELQLGSVIHDLMLVVRRHQLRLPADLAVLLKTLVMHEGLARQLDPGFRLSAVIESYADENLGQARLVEMWARRMARSAAEAVSLGSDVPGMVRRLAMRLDRGELELSLRHDEFDDALGGLSHMLRRLGVTILAAAGIIAWATLRRR